VATDVTQVLHNQTQGRSMSKGVRRNHRHWGKKNATCGSRADVTCCKKPIRSQYRHGTSEARSRSHPSTTPCPPRGLKNKPSLAVACYSPGAAPPLGMSAVVSESVATPPLAPPRGATSSMRGLRSASASAPAAPTSSPCSVAS